jgi:hypothetical protein
MYICMNMWFYWAKPSRHLFASLLLGFEFDFAGPLTPLDSVSPLYHAGAVARLPIIKDDDDDN